MQAEQQRNVYILNGDTTLGPFGREETVALVNSGAVRRDSLVRIGSDGRVIPVRYLMPPQDN